MNESGSKIWCPSRNFRFAMAIGVLLTTWGAGCKRGEKDSAPAGSAEPPTTAIAATASASASPPSAILPPPPTPEGYEPASVLRVALTTHGSAVLLQSEASGRVLPIFVGGTEALSIDLRNEARRYQRPLTHDLLDSLVDNLGGKVIKIHVDDLRSNVFIGRVFVQQEDRLFDVDARPSDAIALALGNRVPIFVSSKVFKVAGMRLEDIGVEGDDSLPDPPTGRPRDPMQL